MLSSDQLLALTSYLRVGAADATLALSRWLGHPAIVSVERVEQMELSDAMAVLDSGEEPVASCIMSVEGYLTGQLVLMMNDASGFSLADLLLGQRPGTANSWGEIERSAALETANIIGCAYLNAIARLFRDHRTSHEILPSPPRFRQDFAQSLLQFALMNQATASDTVFLTETRFTIANSPADWMLLFIPNADAVPKLEAILNV